MVLPFKPDCHAICHVIVFNDLFTLIFTVQMFIVVR